MIFIFFCKMKIPSNHLPSITGVWKATVTEVIDIYDNIVNNDNNHKLMMVLGLIGCSRFGMVMDSPNLILGLVW